MVISNSLEGSSFTEKKIMKKISRVAEYDIINIEKLSGTFNQIKIYVGTKKINNNESIRTLCEEVFKKYSSEYLNVIICVYDNSFIDREKDFKSVQYFERELSEKAWLAMYTFNPIEGVFFDSNPSGYLGSNN